MIRELFILTSALFIFSALPLRAESLDLNRTAEGTGEAVSGAMFRMSGKLFWLRSILDMNETWYICRARYGKKVPPSRFHPKNRPVSPCPAVHNRNFKHACGLTLTPFDQRDRLAELINGKKIRCDYPDETQLKTEWAAGKVDEIGALRGYPITRGGAEIYPAECTIDGKSLNKEMIRRGYAMVWRNSSRRYYDPLINEKISVYRLTRKSRPKNKPFPHSVCKSTVNHAGRFAGTAKKEWFFESPK